MSETSADTTTETPVAEQMDVLSERVRKLEEMVEALRDTGPIEERIVTRLRAERDQRETIAAGPAPPPADKPSAPELKVPVPPQPAPSLKAPWFIFELLSDARNMLAMLLDVQFRVGWTTRVAALVLLAVILTGDWWLPLSGIPFVMKIVDLILAFLLYKILSRETRRYLAHRALRESKSRLA